MPTDRTQDGLIINLLNQSQFVNIVTPSNNELYLIEDDVNLTLQEVITALGYNPENNNNKITSISVSSTNTQYPSAKCVYDELETKANNTDVIKKDGGSGTQSVRSGKNTPLDLKTTDSSNSCYLSFSNSNGYRASLGVNNSRQLIFWNGSTLYTVAMTANIPAIETSLTASSTNAKTVGAKCAYDKIKALEDRITELESRVAELEGKS